MSIRKCTVNKLNIKAEIKAAYKKTKQLIKYEKKIKKLQDKEDKIIYKAAEATGRGKTSKAIRLQSKADVLHELVTMNISYHNSLLQSLIDSPLSCVRALSQQFVEHTDIVIAQEQNDMIINQENLENSRIEGDNIDKDDDAPPMYSPTAPPIFGTVMNYNLCASSADLTMTGGPLTTYPSLPVLYFNR